MTGATGVPSRPPSSVMLLQAGDSAQASLLRASVDDGLSAFLIVRPRLFGIACRIAGNAAEAEDIVQDVWLRWQTANRSAVRDAAAFLVTMTTRLAINVIQSARVRRETYVGSRLLETADDGPDPRLGAERREALASGVLLLLETLPPAERAAYVLREAFDYAYRDIANILRLAEANARQLVSRARKRIAIGKRTRKGSTKQERLLEAFIAAAEKGDLASLQELFALDVASASGAYGPERAADPVRGPEAMNGSLRARRRVAA